MKTYLTYGFGIALVSAIWLLVQYFLGWHNDPDKFVWAERTQQITTLIGVLGIWLGLREIRTSRPNGRISFGRCVGAGLLIALLQGVISVPVVYAYFGKINPEAVEVMKQRQLDKLREAGADDNIVERQQQSMDRFMRPGVMAALTPVASAFTGLIIALLLGMTMIQRLSIMTLASGYAAIFGVMGLFQGFFAGLMKHAALATAGTHLLTGAVLGAAIPLLLLKLTKYEPKPAEDPAAAFAPPPIT